MWNLSTETTWKKEQGLWELTSIFTCSNNGTDGDIFTNIWLFPVPPHARIQSLSTDMSRVCVCRENSSQVSSPNICFLLEANFICIAISFSFKKQNACDRGRTNWKQWNSHQPLQQLFSLAGLWLLLSFCYFWSFFYSGSEGPPIPVVQVQWNSWTTIKCHNQRFIKFLNQKL